MKYCVECKLRGKDGEDACSRCGRPFRVLGGGGRATRKPAETARPVTPSPTHDVVETTTAPASEFQFQLAGLEHRVSQSTRRVRLLSLLALATLVVLAGFLGYLRYSYVMQFAEIDELQVVRSETHPEAMSISYVPRSEGRIEFVRTTNDLVETLVDHSPATNGNGTKREFLWSDSHSQSGRITVKHRDGWSVVSRSVSESFRMVDKSMDGLL